MEWMDNKILLTHRFDFDTNNNTKAKGLKMRTLKTAAEVRELRTKLSEFCASTEEFGMVNRFFYEPGNGTCYEMAIGFFEEDLLVAIPNFRSSYAFNHGGQHWTYVAEKLRLLEGDAVAITELINECFKGME